MVLNRLTGLSSPAGKVQYSYDKSGLVLQRTFGNGTGAKLVWDNASRQTQIALTAGTKTLNLTEYAYDLNGNRLSGTELTRGADTVVTSWTYDRSDNRLTETVVRTGG